MTICSCEWHPKKASVRGSTKENAHMAHRRSLGLPRMDYRGEVFGEGPFMGMTWNDWYAAARHDRHRPCTGYRDPYGA